MIVIANQDNPLVGLQIHFGGGSVRDPVGLEGLTSIAGQLLLRGTTNRSYRALAEAIDGLGATLGVAVGRETVVMEGEVLSHHLEPFVGILVEVLTTSTFPTDRLEHLQRQTIAHLAERRDNDETLVQDIFFQWVNQGDPIARPSIGTRETIGRIQRADVVDCAQGFLMSSNGRIYVAGDTTEAFVESRVVQPLDSLAPGELLVAGAIQPNRPRGVQVVLVDKPERTQSQIMLGHPVIPAAHPDHLALSVGNLIFGGTFTARLSHEIREKRGWSYGAYSQLMSFRHGGVFSYRYYPAEADTADALALGLELFRDLVSDGVTDEEVEFAQSYMINRFAFRVETPWRRLDEVIRVRSLGLADDHLETIVERIRALDAHTINRALRDHLTPNELKVVVVCTAAAVQDAIARLPAVDAVHVHPYEENWPEDGPAG